MTLFLQYLWPARMATIDCQASVDEYMLVNEAETAGAKRQDMEEQQLLIEGAASVAIAVLRKHRRVGKANKPPWSTAAATPAQIRCAAS